MKRLAIALVFVVALTLLLMPAVGVSAAKVSEHITISGSGIPGGTPTNTYGKFVGNYPDGKYNQWWAQTGGVLAMFGTIEGDLPGELSGVTHYGYNCFSAT